MEQLVHPVAECAGDGVDGFLQILGELDDHCYCCASNDLSAKAAAVLGFQDAFDLETGIGQLFLAIVLKLGAAHIIIYGSLEITRAAFQLAHDGFQFLHRLLE